MNTKSRTITISVKKSTGYVFDAILNMPPKLMPDAKKNNDGSWSFSTDRGQALLKFKENKQHGILDHQFADQEAKWNNAMRVISNGDYSEITVTLNKPESLSEQIFDLRTKEMEGIMQSMKQILEQ